MFWSNSRRVKHGYMRDIVKKANYQPFNSLFLICSKLAIAKVMFMF